MENELSQLTEAAIQSAKAGDWQQAEHFWQKVVDLDPNHSQALCSLGVHALQRGDTKLALQRLADARRAAPGDRLILMTQAAACRQANDAANGPEDHHREHVEQVVGPGGLTVIVVAHALGELGPQGGIGEVRLFKDVHG